MNYNNDWIQIEVTREEWDVYSLKEKKHFMGKLSAIDMWMPQFLLECLQEYEKQRIEESRIDFEKTYLFYYGDDK